jgi:poly-gamma-glutamate synthesis protein (capsule biosynthesis protein)
VGRRLGAIAVIAAVIAVVVTAGCSPASHPSLSPPSPTTTTTTPSHSTAPATSAAPAPPAPKTATLLGTGDVLIHPPLIDQAAADAKAAGESGYDFGPIYASIAPVVAKADLATCELETPLAPPQGPFTGYPTFNSPPQVLSTLKKIGYKSCTTASNHSIDQGAAGVTRTLNELDAAGLAHTGSARSAAEAATPLIVTTAQGVKIAQLAYSFNFNGLSLPAGEPWLANLTDVPTILAAAHRAKAAGADIVVLSMHWGVEYTHTATALQKSQAAALLASPDIDVILGDHAHAVQPFEQLNGKWVIYCMGNQISRHEQPNDDNREGVMPIFTFTQSASGAWAVSRVEAVPTWMQITPQLRLIDLPAALADPSTSAADRATYQHAHDQIAGYLNAYGANQQGLVVD